MAGVVFRYGSQREYDQLPYKDENSLYYLYDSKRTYCGATLHGAGLSAREHNSLFLERDGLFVPSIPSYSLVKTDGENTYRLVETLDGAQSYVGDEIVIPVDLVVESGSLRFAERDNVPYAGAVEGEPYLDIVLNDPNADHIYIPVKGLVDVYVAGDGIDVTNNVISLRISDTDAHGLSIFQGALTLGLATSASDGAMSKTDKQYIDTLPNVLAGKVNMLTESEDGRSFVHNEGAYAGTRFVHEDGSESFFGTAGSRTGALGQMYVINSETGFGTRLAMTKEGAFYRKNDSSAVFTEDDELVTKKDLRDIDSTIYWGEMTN